MYRKAITLIIVSLLWTGFSALYAQQSILSTSFNAIGIDGEVSYSVGQIAFNTNIGADGTITEGVQQPYEILFMTGIGEESEIILKCMVFPNPANDNVRLKIEGQEILNPTCQLIDMNGVVLQDIKIVRNETTIFMADLAAATYFLTVFVDGKLLQTYKIIKK
ncbi:MAG: T9SS type A sorting domain-containing protein [Bacteroidales bacterium]|nr:T9SS type A sorting domain-containing protein [Bacteroidales bacterium]